ncbi:hypothetical protein P153DRAFT_362931 [Dothidotthia symphoricarpi CBS 119687]|uniref:N-acetyltransferase domain-containing protein n=1 Tax=Dothidotthia symphoricarpi CBS 119687 TaxID=1392245 RepID=A0A6A6APP3_9PLEO|nr:uncharacterized protein P153DRAFT_362931 [Dothidotthia symphoricarpi CBS 119687]KAF2133889.1 hypothetical protein P153DRAFT_362931 [Dothidotthia symphoricarpi CBS 119687]
MTTSRLSTPTLFTPSELQSNPSLAKQIVELVNKAFTRSHAIDPGEWILPSTRFANIESLHEMLSPESVMAVIFESSDSGDKNEESEVIRNRKIVVCAAAVSWKGGWMKEGAGVEEGWEIKTVCVDGDVKYLRQGLALQLLASLENHLIEQMRRQPLDWTPAEKAIKTKESTGVLTLWVMSVESMTGPYWRKRGYQEIRRKVYGKGVWGCLTSFEMVVLRKYVPFDLVA